jgi:hypothetical protein
MFLNMNVNLNALNLISFIYLTCRISPIILVSFFVLNSVINEDLKGLFLLIGLIITAGLAKAIGNLGYIFTNRKLSYKFDTCNAITIGSNGIYSNIPLGITAVTYIFFYVIYPYIKYNTIKSFKKFKDDELKQKKEIEAKIDYMNTVLTTWRISFFTIYIFINLIWLMTMKCANPFAIVASVCIGISVALIYAYIIDIVAPDKLYFADTMNNKEKCSMYGRLFTCN